MQRLTHRIAATAHIPLIRGKRVKTTGDLKNSSLSHSVDQEISLAVDQNRGPHGVRPEIIVRGTPQRGLDATQYHRQSGEGMPQQVRIDNAGTIRARSGATTGRVSIVMTLLPKGGVMRNHRIQRTGSDTRKQPWAPHA